MDKLVLLLSFSFILSNLPPRHSANRPTHCDLKCAVVGIEYNNLVFPPACCRCVRDCLLYSLFSDLFQNIHTFVDSQLYTLLRVKWYVKMYSRILLDHSHTHTHTKSSQKMEEGVEVDQMELPSSC